MKKQIFSLALLALTATAIISCSSDDDSVPVVINGGDDDGMAGGGSDDPNKDGVIEGQDDPDLDPADLKGDVTASVTLTADQTWTLNGPLAVKSGATLTIEAGTRIEATSGGTNVFLVVEQGAMINADADAANPIVFTSAAANPRAGDWGGVLINGFAPISGGGTSTTEVLPLPYGGTNATDDSGVMDYVLIEYTGARINGEKEFNGLTLYAVGSQTQISNIALNKGDDDAIEFFGGTVSVTNLFVVDARDDMFDWTQGWVSTGNSNWYGVRTAGFTSISEDTRGIEGDGNLDGNSPSDMGQSNPTIDGLTIENAGIIEFADLIKIRRGSKATITNAVATITNGDGSASDFVDLTDCKGTATNDTSINITAGGSADGSDVKTSTTCDSGTVSTSATVTVTTTNTGADTSVFGWAGISL